jgi:hypothetical protein
MSIYDKHYWNYKKYITKPLDKFPTTGIVVKLSGGADSSIVYYRLCYEIAKRKLNLPIYVATLDPETKDWYSHYAKKVIKFTEEQTGVKPVEHRIVKLPLPWGLEDYSKVQDEIQFSFMRDGLANVYYGGLTQNPDPKIQARTAFKVPGTTFRSLDEALKLSYEAADPTRQTHSKKFAIGYGRPDNVDVPKYLGIVPFMHRDKKNGTAAMYKEMKITDDLLPLTYSCEERRPSEKQKLGIVDGYQEYSHCGKCWFCMERAYAFGRLV